MRTLCTGLLVLELAAAAWAITPAEQQTIATCYQLDATARGKDAPAMVAELLNFIFLGRAQQKTQLANALQRCRDRITAQQGTLEADQAAAAAALTSSGTDTDAAAAAVPTLP